MKNVHIRKQVFELMSFLQCFIFRVSNDALLESFLSFYFLFYTKHSSFFFSECGKNEHWVKWKYFLYYLMTVWIWYVYLSGVHYSLCKLHQKPRKRPNLKKQHQCISFNFDLYWDRDLIWAGTQTAKCHTELKETWQNQMFWK